MESTYTRSKLVTLSMLLSSALIVTGYVLLPPAASRVSRMKKTLKQSGACCADVTLSLPFSAVFDLESKSIVDELKPEFVGVGKNSADPECLSLAWSADGSTLFAGYSDNKVRIFTVG
jgi:hypothetical protein